MFHTKSGLESAVDQFLLNKPWIKREARLGGLQTDNASNYRDQVLIVDTAALGSHVFSERGMGKVTF